MHSFVTHITYNDLVLFIVAVTYCTLFAIEAFPRASDLNYVSVQLGLIACTVIHLVALATLQHTGILTVCSHCDRLTTSATAK